MDQEAQQRGSHQSDHKSSYNSGDAANIPVPKDDHQHLRNSSSQKLWIIFAITLFFMIIEGGVGYLINSLSLISDAGHMLNDVLSIGLAIIAISIAGASRSKEFTFGLNRVEVISGLINGISLLAIAIYVVNEAISRFQALDTIHIQGNIMLITAIIGLGVNIVGLYVLEGEFDDNLNIEGAYQHIIADLLGSIAAIIASIGIIIWQAFWLDIVVSVVISALILKSGISITWRAIRIILEANPHVEKIDTILGMIKEINGVLDIHDFHGWSISSDQNIMTGHLTIASNCDQQVILGKAIAIARSSGFHHPTFQVEIKSCNVTSDCFPNTSKPPIRSETDDMIIQGGQS